ncbi:MAG: insulinase family protein, partial [Lachnospiraceae bacterium]|nr:insulinase family protein [Lachnospiraceae bacterium]
MNIHELNAYEILEERWIEDVKSTGVILRHKKSGARVALLSNQDDNKVFYIGFRTAPEDETGVPHIIEHTVLCGSEKFPLKDPFVELVKGSLNTFLNAMTYPDKTIYPVASCNDVDFQNLMHVYLDAVFYPNIYIHEETFRQEGWHYELEDKDAPLIYNGVVYNEMKGAFSSPEQILYRKITDTLFPDTIYSFESGGDPDAIPELTYEQYLDFHRKYYHPSNSYIYLYGNMDVNEKLNFIDKEYLQYYDAMEVDSFIPKQAAFDEIALSQGEYPIGAEDSEDNASYMACSWVVGDSLDPKLYLAFQILEYALMEAPGAPLKQALLDQEFGEDVYGFFETSLIQPYLTIIIKNMDAARRDDIL